MDFLKKLKNLAGATYHGVTPFDKGQGWTNQRPAPVPTPPPSGDNRNIFSKVADQINWNDNGRTFKQATPTNNRSTVQQLLDNGLTHVATNTFVKPVTNTFTGDIIEPARATFAQITGNKAAEDAANKRAQIAQAGSLPQMIVKPFAELGWALGHVPAAVNREIHNKPITDIQQSAFGTTNEGDIAKKIIGNTVQAGLTVAAPELGGTAVEASAPVVGKLSSPFLQQLATNAIRAGAEAPVGAAWNTAATISSNPDATAKDLWKAAGQGALLAGGISAAYGAPGVIKAGIEEAGPAVSRAATATREALSPEAVAARNPAVQAVNDHLTLLNRLRERYLANGLSEKSPQVINNAKAYAAAVAERDRLTKQVSEGGYVSPNAGRTSREADYTNRQSDLLKNDVFGENPTASPQAIAQAQKDIADAVKLRDKAPATITPDQALQGVADKAYYDKYIADTNKWLEAKGVKTNVPAEAPLEVSAPQTQPALEVQSARPVSVGEVLDNTRSTTLTPDNRSSAQGNSYPQSTPVQIKVKGPMSREDYIARYGKEPSAGAPVKVKPFTAQDYAFDQWKDKSALGLGRETLERNLDRVAGKDAPAIKEFLVQKSRDNELARANFLNEKRGEIRQNVVKDLGIKAGSKESALVQKYGEKQPGIDEAFLVKAVGEQKAANIIKASEYLRNEYDNLLDQWNATRAKYGYAPIPKRADYFRHFQEISNTINQVGMVLRQEDLPTSISGITDIFNPGKPFSTAELRRRGTKTKEDAIGGFDNYLDNVSRQIYHLDTVQRGRAIEQAIRKQSAAMAEGPRFDAEGNATPQVELPNFVANLHEWVNGVAGKKSKVDRAAEAFLGRKVYGAANALRSQTGANMVGANLSSAMSNFIPFTQSIATTSKPAFVRGILDTLSSPFGGKLTAIDGQQSSFLTRRFQDESIATHGVRKASEIASTPFKAVDEFTSRSIVAGKYYEARKAGLTPAEAMKSADDYAARVLTDRSIGQTPNLFNVKTAGFINQFQTEINNQVSFLMRDIPQFKNGNPAKIAGALAQFTIFSYLFNTAYEKATGQRPQIDPIQAALNITGTADPNADTSARVKAATQNIATGLPFTSIFTGGRLPVNAMLPDVGAITKGVGNAVSGEGPVASELYKGLSGPLFYGLPPFGGGQLKKTVEGGNSIAKGYSETPAGQVRFNTTNESPADKLKTLLFGQYAGTPGREYIKGGAKPLGQDQSELFKALAPGDRQTYVDRISNERQANQQVKKLQSGADKGKTTPSGKGGEIGGGIIQLKTGKFTANINGDYKTFDSQDKAQKAIDKAGLDKQVEDFKKSDKKTITIGDTYYYKTKSGDVKNMSKGEYDWNQSSSKLDLALSRAYNDNDLGAWLNVAQNKYQALEEKKNLYDPDTEGDKINDIVKQQEALIEKAQGYQEKGYIRKSGTGGKKKFTPPNRGVNVVDSYRALSSLLSKSKAK